MIGSNLNPALLAFWMYVDDDDDDDLDDSDDDNDDDDDDDDNGKTVGAVFVHSWLARRLL